jgi:type IV pilus assembly protein PilN
VKPIHLNLASRPYRDYRPVYAVVVLLSLLTAFLMLNNVETYYRYIHETQATRAKIAQVEEQARLEREKEQSAKQRLKGLDLEKLDQKTKFINAKLAERAFSWSRLLDELESILRDDVRLVSVSPGFTDEGPIQLSLSFETKSSDGMIETINRMNADPQFRDAFPSTENQNEGGTYSFVLSAQYLPDAPDTVLQAKVTR